MIEKIGGLTFKDGYLVTNFNEEAEIAKRGGIDAMFKQSLKNNALLARLVGERAIDTDEKEPS